MDSKTPIYRGNRSRSFFWVSTLAIAVISILLTLNATTIPNASSSSINGIEDEIATEVVVEESFIAELVSLLKRIARRATRRRKHPHHHPKGDESRCDGTKWMAMIERNNLRPSLVLTVDLMGCGNFSSLQNAVDAVPDNSPGRTVILISPGVYRL